MGFACLNALNYNNPLKTPFGGGLAHIQLRKKAKKHKTKAGLNITTLLFKLFYYF